MCLHMILLKTLDMKVHIALLAAQELSSRPPSAPLDEFALQRTLFFSRMPVQIGAVLAKAAAARLVQYNIDGGLSVLVTYGKNGTTGSGPP
jgi:hypothetical protein